MNGDTPATRPVAATILGLALALGVPLAVLPTGLLLRVAPGDSVTMQLIREGAYWALASLVIIVMVMGERQGVDAIGLRRPHWGTFGWGILTGIVLVILFPLTQMVLRILHVSLPIHELARLDTSPIWLQALTLIRIGVTEELLFRAYAIGRVTALTRSRALGVIVPWAVFVFCHLESWSVPHLFYVGVAGAILSALYVLRRDLISNIIAHIFVDGAGFLAAAYMVHSS